MCNEQKYAQPLGIPFQKHQRMWPHSSPRRRPPFPRHTQPSLPRKSLSGCGARAAQSHRAGFQTFCWVQNTLLLLCREYFAYNQTKNNKTRAAYVSINLMACFQPWPHKNNEIHLHSFAVRSNTFLLAYSARYAMSGVYKICNQSIGMSIKLILNVDCLCRSYAKLLYDSWRQLFYPVSITEFKSTAI